jgi:hypothetical protein
MTVYVCLDALIQQHIACGSYTHLTTRIALLIVQSVLTQQSWYTGFSQEREGKLRCCRLCPKPIALLLNKGVPDMAFLATLAAAARRYRRAAQATRADGAEAAMTAATPSLLMAAATQQRQVQQPGQGQQQEQRQGQDQGQQQGQEQGLPGSNPASDGCRASACTNGLLNGKSHAAAAAPAAAPAPAETAACCAPLGQPAQTQQGLPAQQQAPEAAEDTIDGTKGQDYLQARLKQYVDKRHMHLLSACTQFINILSPYQNALLVSLSYPWWPSFTAIAEVLTQRQALRLLQRAAALQSGPMSSRSCSPPAAAGSPVAAATAGSDGPAVSNGGAGQQSFFLQGVIQQYRQRRMQELQTHRELFWSELNTTMLQQMVMPTV